MPTSAAEAANAASVSYHDVLSDDGTRLTAWTNDPEGKVDGPTVVLCNGLGTNPWAWPALLHPECGVRVVSWNHRGTGGSDRPTDPDAAGIESFVEDALSVMDHFDLERPVLMGWSMGVNTMFELAFRNPERVAGLFAVCGVPGDTFATMLGPLHLPHLVARTLTVNAARVGRLVGGALQPLTTRLPIGWRAVSLLTHSGFMLPVRDPELAALAVRDFLTTPLGWYFHLALRSSEHGRVSLSRLQVPTAFVAGRWDVLAGSRDMATAAERVPGASYVELGATHFAPMEQPERVHQLLLAFLTRVGDGVGDGVGADVDAG